jgi:pimeloyl-ACP methyl ester carboxylesterase
VERHDRGAPAARAFAALSADEEDHDARREGRLSAQRLPVARHVIVFSHANSYPAGTYRVLFDEWRRAGFEVAAIERIGHDPRFPVTGNWPHLRDELLAFIDAQAQHGDRTWLVGHSLGGYLSLMAASARPGLARGVVLLDSPFVAGWRAHLLRLAKATGVGRRLSPGHVARQRRCAWPSREGVRAHFAGKRAFARWDARTLADYVQSGFVERDGQVHLAFDRQTEARIYDTIPDHIGALLRRHPLRCPVAFIGGLQSREARQAGTAATHKLAGREQFVWTPGTHLFPMEHPHTTAALVLRFIDAWRRKDSA